MIFDAHGDILTHVTMQHEQGIDIWNTYHKPKYSAAGVSGSIFVNFTDPASATQRDEFGAITKVALPYFKAHPDMNIILNKDDFRLDKFNLIFGIEGMGAIESSEELVDLYDLGYRHIGITWNEQNDFASGTTHSGGLTAEGQKLIRKCNELGMIVDFAHLNYQSFMEAAAVTTKPIFFSHGNVRSLCDHVRNLDDEQLQLVAQSNGIIGLAAMNFFINEDKTSANIEDLVNHVVYVKEHFGIDHVGFGFDFCYYLSSSPTRNDVEGLHHIDDVANVIELLKQAGLTAEEIEKVCYKNMLRVIKEHLN
ncbi:membrane dipeptidase [Mollicutes bacterium LVI A0039]|nr:membrane dipeptidase [Mollicutes bacterium LVI A0039]